jgi:hypothetical protein
LSAMTLSPASPPDRSLYVLQKNQLIKRIASRDGGWDIYGNHGVVD